MCEEKEAYAMGNCMWTEYSTGRQFLDTLFLYTALSNTAFFNGVPTYVLAGSIVDCAAAIFSEKVKNEACLTDLTRFYKDPYDQFKDNKITAAGQIIGVPIMSLITQSLIK
jgi:hypothetical protein